ncbi:hypothetical protein BN1723_017046 [Verticillium longisporum]|uniref:Uncharacterized protein n=1 Tax=Verticillium longisporum TaxID=100787 RepID=A0A0G4KGS6_VERLO|nr:hypothetical protein BN1723_017046 [Verticillium longisporum]
MNSRAGDNVSVIKGLLFAYAATPPALPPYANIRPLTRLLGLVRDLASRPFANASRLASARHLCTCAPGLQRRNRLVLFRPPPLPISSHLRIFATGPPSSDFIQAVPPTTPALACKTVETSLREACNRRRDNHIHQELH